MKKVVYLFSAITVAVGMAMLPQEAKANPSQNDLGVVQEVNYQEIPTENVPETVTKSLEKDYSGYKIDKAYLGDDGSYKLDISQGDVKYVVFYKENGELIKVEKPAGEEIEEGPRQEGVEDKTPEMKK